MLALFVALSGVSYGVATGSIDSREIKNNDIRSIDIRNNEIRTADIRNNQVRGMDIRNSTIRSRDVALNTLTGNDINESTLGQVPSAASADTANTATTANSAGSANSVGGLTLRRIAYSGEVGSGFVEILSLGGLRLEARCAAGPALEVRANPSAANGWIGSNFGSFDQNDNDFDPGDNTLVVDGVDAAGQITYAAAGGTVVTVQALARQQTNGVRGTNDCGFFGVAQAG